MRLKEGFRKRKLGNDYILTDENSDSVNMNRLIGLNATASYLWDSVVGKDFDAETLRDLLLKRYDVDEERAGADASGIAESWIKNGLAE